jgi:hypothetical protein
MGAARHKGGKWQKKRRYKKSGGEDELPGGRGGIKAHPLGENGLNAIQIKRNVEQKIRMLRVNFFLLWSADEAVTSSAQGFLARAALARFQIRSDSKQWTFLGYSLRIPCFSIPGSVFLYTQRNARYSTQLTQLLRNAY